jgi:hypothetical protein
LIVYDLITYELLYPNIVQITVASAVLNDVSQIVPHSPLWNNSILPFEGFVPSTNLTIVSVDRLDNVMINFLV